MQSCHPAPSERGAGWRAPLRRRNGIGLRRASEFLPTLRVLVPRDKETTDSHHRFNRSYRQMRALLHVLDPGREFSVASPLSTLLPMASQPSEMSSCNWMMRTCRFVLGRADGSGRSDCGTLAGKLVDASPVGL